MSKKTFHRASLVLVELGAAWPAPLVEGEGTRRVLAEIEGEGPLAFAARVEDFAASAFPRGTQISLALVACNQRADETAEAARRAVSECLLAAVAPAGSLHFVASEDATDRFRRRLFDLVAELGKVAGEHRVRVLFGDQGVRSESGPLSSEGSTLPNRTARVA